MSTGKSSTDRHLYPTRLFNVKTQRFTHALRKDYAILSHRWSDNEISYQDLAIGTQNRSFASYHKFDGFCRAAEAYSCQYIWVDSACIDQTDEEELDKSIQSMFSWYQNAKVCIVYLADAFSIDEIPASSWFTRGWTLQEFLAPRRMVFYFGDWRRSSSAARFDVIRQGDYFIHDDESAYDDGSYGTGDFDEGEEGTKLRDLIMTAAGLVNDRWGESAQFLDKFYTPSMQNLRIVCLWAEKRQTTRPEDAAYSLVSLLSICLPPNYGEGKERAMDRLHHACHPLPSSFRHIDIYDRMPENNKEYYKITSADDDKERLCPKHKAMGGHPILLRLETEVKRKSLSKYGSFLLYTSVPFPPGTSLVKDWQVEYDVEDNNDYQRQHQQSPFHGRDGRIPEFPVYLVGREERRGAVDGVLQYCSACCYVPSKLRTFLRSLVSS